MLSQQKKRIGLFQFAFAAWMLIVMALTGCKNNPTETTADTPSDSAKVEQENTYLTAIYDYLVNQIGKNYAEAEYCVPYYNIVAADESNAEDIQVWGDFWVFNYNLAGDTLKTISGGNHPGLMHVRKTDSGYKVTGFDQVADGADNLESAKKIFGDKYEAFQTFQGDENKREQLRAEMLSDYVKSHNLKATMYQDTGWPAKALP